MSNEHIRYTRQFENDLHNFLKDVNLNAVFFEKSDFKSKKDLKLFSLFDKNNDNVLSTEEVCLFLNCIKGGDENNINFDFDNEHFDKFLKAAQIGDEDKIKKETVESLFAKITKLIANEVLNYKSQDIMLSLPENMENNITLLDSEVSFVTQNKKFNKLLNFFDTDVKNGKLSQKEVQSLWNKIKNECVVQKNGVATFDKDKIQNFINTNFKDSNISVSDVLSFIETINLSLTARTSNSSAINWAKYDISEPNAKVDKKFNQHGIGDCWFTSVLLALSTTDVGRNIINNCLSKDDKGNIYVRFKGANETYIVTPDDLKLKSNQFSQGDGDIRAIEIALNKYFNARNIKNGIDGGIPSTAYYLLTGIDARNNKYRKKPTDNVIDSLDLSKQVAIVSYAGHATALVKVDDKYVYQLNQLNVNWRNDNPTDKNKYFVEPEKFTWESINNDVDLSELIIPLPKYDLKKWCWDLYVFPLPDDIND